VLAVSKEPKSVVEEFVEELEAKHPIVVESGNSMSAYGATGYPSAFLIGPDGDIVWAGHPAGLKNETIEEALAAVRLLPDLPTSLASIGKLLEKDKYGDAFKKLSKLLEKLEGEDKEVGEKTLAWIDSRGSKGIERAAKFLRDGEVSKSYKRYDNIADLFKNHDYGKQAKLAAADIMANKEYKNEIKAEEKWLKIRPKLEGLAPKKALKVIHPMLAKKFRDTKYGKIAKKKADDWKRILE